MRSVCRPGVMTAAAAITERGHLAHRRRDGYLAHSGRNPVGEPHSLVREPILGPGGGKVGGWERVHIDGSIQDTEYRYILNYRLTVNITQGSVN